MHDPIFIRPIAANKDKGFYAEVTESEIKAHLNRSLGDIFNWLENTNKFISALQTDTEKERSRKAKLVYNPIEFP
ncbi:hypothetical protein [Flexithrix dorotheae]|uniref:hypothetical protein n=1 Tax=Flexithrix dorotheae TaxID=70993 RepID=UPI00036DAF83|nr:hypothetical protein [Flexithrix dorotheae]